MRQWVEEAVSVLAEERPLASSVDLVDVQNRRLKVSHVGSTEVVHSLYHSQFY